MPASPLVAVDVVIFNVQAGQLNVLLVRVKRGPTAGKWAFPGGLVAVGEAPLDTATRELEAQTGITDIYLEQLETFGDPERDPRRHVVSVAHFALLPRRREAVPASEKYGGVAWFPVGALPDLAYDHSQIARHALDRLRAKLGYTNIAYSLLPAKFTISELQEIYEIILGKRFDRRNFRKKILALGLLRRHEEQRRGPHRPAQLYSFKERKLVTQRIL